MFPLLEIAQALLLALVIDRFIGDPGWFYRYIPHPIEVIGGVLSRLERWSFRRAGTDGEKARYGQLTTLITVLICVALGLLLQWLCLLMPMGWVLLGLLMSPLLAQVSLADHVRAVGDGLEESLEAGRDAVSHIVGRDPEQLDAHGVARAAVESLAENFSDGVVAPAFYAFFLGLPGILAYKAINTADSMIGHKSERYLHFGRFAARLDDVANWLPARFSAMLIVIGARLMYRASADHAWMTISRDAHRHRSPNAGWPEAAMAGALDIRLSGPRSYDGKTSEEAWIGLGTPDLTPQDIDHALQLFWWACGVLMALVLLFIVLI